MIEPDQPAASNGDVALSANRTRIFAAAQLSLTDPRVIPLSVVLTDSQGGSTGPVGLNLTIAPVGP
jgi:hypothetical protein